MKKGAPADRVDDDDDDDNHGDNDGDGEKKTLIPSRFFLCSVPAGDRRAAGEAAGVGAEAGGVRGPAEGSGRAGPEGADGVPGPAGGVGGAPAPTAGRQGPADEGHHQQVGRRRASVNMKEST